MFRVLRVWIANLQLSVHENGLIEEHQEHLIREYRVITPFSTGSPCCAAETRRRELDEALGIQVALWGRGLAERGAAFYMKYRFDLLALSCM